MTLHWDTAIATQEYHNYPFRLLREQPVIKWWSPNQISKFSPSEV